MVLAMVETSGMILKKWDGVKNDLLMTNSRNISKEER